MAKRVENLIDVKVGDKFLVCQNHGFRRDAYWAVVVCEKVTPKKCTIGGRIYRKSDAKEEGTYFSYPFEYDPILEEEGKAYLRMRRVENFNYEKLSDSQKEEIYQIIKENL